MTGVRRDRQKLERFDRCFRCSPHLSTTFRCELGGCVSNWTRLSSETGAEFVWATQRQPTKGQIGSLRGERRWRWRGKPRSRSKVHKMGFSDFWGQKDVSEAESRVLRRGEKWKKWNGAFKVVRLSRPTSESTSSPQAGRGDQVLSDILVFWYSGILVYLFRYLWLQYLSTFSIWSIFQVFSLEWEYLKGNISIYVSSPLTFALIIILFLSHFDDLFFVLKYKGFTEYNLLRLNLHFVPRGGH